MTTAIEPLDALIGTGPEQLRPLLAAVRDRGCSLWSIPPVADILRLDQGGPLILLIDDSGAEAVGPGAFRSGRFMAAQLRPRVAQCTVALVTSVAAIEAYADIAAHAGDTRKDVVVVETAIEHERAWLEFLFSAQPELDMLVARSEEACT